MRDRSVMGAGRTAAGLKGFDRVDHVAESE
jgi:hypothetical protein